MVTYLASNLLHYLLTFMTPEHLKKFIDDFEDDDKLFELDSDLQDKALQALLGLWNKMIDDA